jgi:Domain of unknown function (DUF4350)
MRSGRNAWLLLAAIFAVASALTLAQSGSGQDSPEHSSSSDGPNGTSALSQYAATLGHPVHNVDLAFSLPDPPFTLFVFNPSAFSAGESSTLDHWVRAGGTLIYADDQLDTRLALAFDLHKGSPVPAEGTAATPALPGVSHVTDQSYTEPYRPTADQAILVRYAATGGALALEEKLGQGRVIALATPEVLCNGWLEVADNGRLAADLLSLTPGPVGFDEFHHGAGGTGAGDWTSQPLGLGLGWAALAIFVGLLLRGRAFGPRLSPGRGGARSAAEYAVAVGHLLRQAGGRGLVLRVVTDATRRSLAARLGLGRDLPLTLLDEVLVRRAPDVAELYREAAAEAAAATESEPALLAAARRLHDLAYPMARR